MDKNEEEEAKIQPGFTLNIHFPALVKLSNSFDQVVNNLSAAISSGIGRLYEPIEIVRFAQADRKALLIRAQTAIDLAELAGKDFEGDPNFALKRRAIERLLNQEAERQSYRESIMKETLHEIERAPPKEDASKAIDHDWLTRFWLQGENTSEDKVREFLALLLAKEIKIPGSFCPQTLSILPAFSSDLAKRFQHFCCLSIDDGSEVFVIHPNVFAFQNIGPLLEFGVSLEDLYEFEGCGLIRSAETLMLNFGEFHEVSPEAVNYAGRKAQFDRRGKQLRLLQFTRPGREIRRLLSLEPVQAYTDAIARYGSNFLKILAGTKNS